MQGLSWGALKHMYRGQAYEIEGIENPFRFTSRFNDIDIDILYCFSLLLKAKADLLSQQLKDHKYEDKRGKKP